jgi:hypothetical protein
LDSKRQREYLLLRTYEENIDTRGVLLRMPFVALEQIENNTWGNIKFSNDEKVRLRSIIQVDIISKIMMYIEDLAVLSESFIQNRDFYEILVDENINIGRLTGDFIRDVTSFSDESIFKIMNYAQPDRISADKESVKLLNKLLEYHVKKTRNNLSQVANFSSEANHLL